MDVRIYDTIYGRLNKIYNQILDDKNPNAELTSLCFNFKHSKFFVTDTAGLVRQFNLKNGSLLNKVDKKYLIYYNR